MQATLLALPDEIDHPNHQLAWQYPLACPPKRGSYVVCNTKFATNLKIITEAGLFPMKSRKWRNQVWRTHEPPSADPPLADPEDGERVFVVQAALAC